MKTDDVLRELKATKEGLRPNTDWDKLLEAVISKIEELELENENLEFHNDRLIGIANDAERKLIAENEDYRNFVLYSKAAEEDYKCVKVGKAIKYFLDDNDGHISFGYDYDLVLCNTEEMLEQFESETA